MLNYLLIILNILTILIIGSIIAIAMMAPSAFATSGTIELEDDEFTLYGDGTVTIFSIHGIIHDNSHHPILEISHNDVVIKTVKLVPVKNSLFTVLGLDRDWHSGKYFVNLIHQNELLDSKPFHIFRDNLVEDKIIVHENMFDTEQFLQVEPSKIILDSASNEFILISGNIQSSHFGVPLQFFLHHPDGTSELMGTVQLPRSGLFDYPIIGIDKNWNSGEYQISVELPTISNASQLKSSFVIENNFQKYPMEKEKLLGSFILSSETSNDYTILGITGNVKTDESEMILQISKDDIVLFEDTLSISDNLFETNTVLYDYDSNTSWVAGDYRVSGLIGDESFYSDVFRLDEQNLTVFEISSMDLFLNFESEVQKMVDTDEIIISYGDEKQIILSGVLENYISGETVEVHLINPDGTDTVSHLRPSSDGEYYMPIIVDESWVSGSYTAYVTHGTFNDEPSSFNVINNVIQTKEEIDEEEEVDESILEELENYSIILNNSQSVDSVHFIAEMNSYSGKTPITISLNNELVSEEFSYSSNEGIIDYYLLLDESWISGNYVVSYIENNISIPFGNFEIFNNYIVNEISDNTASEEFFEKHLELDKSIFKTSSHVVEYLTLSGKLIDDSTKKISISLNGDLQTIVSLDSEGNYSETISLGDNLNSGYHTVSISSGNTTQSSEFLIASNHYVSLDTDLEIFRNTIAESGGEISIFLSKMVPNFVPSEIQPVIITIEGDDYYKRFSVMPKGYGFYSHNFMIDDSLGSYDVTVKYDDTIIESHKVTVILPEPEWIKSHTALWLNGDINDYSYFKKIVLLLDETYEVTPQVTSPEWFVESADNWMNGLMDDDSFNDALLFLAENRLL
jgi:hypothetical protein